MSKSNPLFVDSTKFHGDLIATQIELRNIMIYDDEQLYVVITNHQGDSKRIQMKMMDERSFEARIHLNHQTLVTYRFVIEKNGVNLLYSEAHKGRAQYALIALWEPTPEDAAAFPASASSVALATSQPAGAANPNWPRDSAVGIRSLIDKWGF